MVTEGVPGGGAYDGGAPPPPLASPRRVSKIDMMCARAAATPSTGPVMVIDRSVCPGSISLSRWICTCTPSRDCKSRTFSPPRPMTEPMARMGTVNVSAACPAAMAAAAAAATLPTMGTAPPIARAPAVLVSAWVVMLVVVV